MKTRSMPEVSFMHYGGKPPENYERYFVPTIGAAWATALLEVSGLRSGERVLDVACGTGIVTRGASELVGPEGFVAGLDVNPGMLAVARSVSPTSIEWHESSAESIPCPDASFDVVTCSLGLQFVPDRSAAMRDRGCRCDPPGLRDLGAAPRSSREAGGGGIRATGVLPARAPGTA